MYKFYSTAQLRSVTLELLMISETAADAALGSRHNASRLLAALLSIGVKFILQKVKQTCLNVK
jgi:hypothetical protein